MDVQVKVALISAAAVVVAALVGMFAVMVQARRAVGRVEQSVQTPPDAPSVAAMVATTSADVAAVRRVQTEQGQRLAVVETRLGDHLADVRSQRVV